MEAVGGACILAYDVAGRDECRNLVVELAVVGEEEEAAPALVLQPGGLTAARRKNVSAVEKTQTARPRRSHADSGARTCPRGQLKDVSHATLRSYAAGMIVGGRCGGMGRAGEASGTVRMGRRPTGVAEPV